MLLSTLTQFLASLLYSPSLVMNFTRCLSAASSVLTVACNRACHSHGAVHWCTPGRPAGSRAPDGQLQRGEAGRQQCRCSMSAACTTLTCEVPAA